MVGRIHFNKRIVVGWHIQYTVLIVLLFKFSAYSQIEHGTTIIVRECPMGIFVGADSRITDSAFVPLPIIDCKVQTVGDSVIYFGTGTTRIDPIYNSYTLIDSYLHANVSPLIARDSLITRILNISTYLSSILNGDSIRMNKLFHNDGLFQFMIIQRIGTTFNYYYVSFKIFMRSGNVSIIPDTILLDNHGFWTFGQVERVISSHIGVTGKTPEEVVGKIYRMIELECANPNNGTGKPIFVLWWNRQGQMKWYGDKEPCTSESERN